VNVLAKKHSMPDVFCSGITNIKKITLVFVLGLFAPLLIFLEDVALKIAFTSNDHKLTLVVYKANIANLN